MWRIKVYTFEHRSYDFTCQNNLCCKPLVNFEWLENIYSLVRKTTFCNVKKALEVQSVLKITRNI